jgi:hypothetical protein
MLKADFDTLISKGKLDRVLAGEMGHNLNDLINICVEDYQSDELGMPRSSPTLNVAKNVPSTPSALDFHPVYTVVYI